MAINLSRNTRLWISTVDKDGAHTNANTFELPVQEGYSLSQSVSTVDVSVEEAGPAPIRGSKRFNSALDPVDWSLATYISPYMDTNHYLVDMLLWHSLASGIDSAPDMDNAAAAVAGDTSSFDVSFINNSAHVLTELYLYFKIDNQFYYIAKAQVSQAEISIDIADIGMVSWSGQGLTYEPIPNPAFFTGTAGAYVTTGDLSGYVKIPTNKNFLVNKLTLMSMTSDMAPGGSSNNAYDIPITSANITINNNITYLTPNTLAEVDSPIGSFTGSFEVTGTIEAYLKDIPGADGNATPYGSADLLGHMLANVQGAVTNAANIVFKVGGGTGPRAEFTIPTAHLSVPDISVDDVVSTSIEFKAIPSSAELASGDEITASFFAQ